MFDREIKTISKNIFEKKILTNIGNLIYFYRVINRKKFATCSNFSTTMKYVAPICNPIIYEPSNNITISTYFKAVT